MATMKSPPQIRNLAQLKNLLQVKDQLFIWMILKVTRIRAAPQVKIDLS
jgi:hypothetical protein